MDDQVWDLVIIGAGPAGLSAAIYAAREHLSTLIFEHKTVGGMVASTDKLDNYPGFENGVGGLELADKMKAQAKKYGAKIGLAQVVGLESSLETKLVHLANGQSVRARSVLIASGNDYRHLDIKGEAEMIGKGVHFCATCDAAFYKDRVVIVIGGGNSALEETVYIAKFAAKIEIVSLTELTATPAIQAEIKPFIESGKVVIHTLVNSLEIMAEKGQVTGVKGQRVDTKEPVEIAGAGIFVFVGLIPNTSFLKSSTVDLDDQGFVLADDNNQTSIAGVFVAGDVKSGATHQAVVASGDGVVSALAIGRYLQYNKDSNK